VWAAAAFRRITALVGTSAAPPERRNRSASGQADRADLLAEPFAARVGLPLIYRGRGLLGRLLPTSWVRGIEYRLVLAGEPVSLHGLLTIQVVAVMGGVFVAVVGISGGGGAVRVLATFVAGLGWVATIYWLGSGFRRATCLIKLFPCCRLIVTDRRGGVGARCGPLRGWARDQVPARRRTAPTVRETTLGRGPATRSRGS